ncbi:MAG: hypothetical protein SynsKO_35380 [Synoicihabitans sp.]
MTSRHVAAWLGGAMIAVASSGLLRAADDDALLISFREEIEPVLDEFCYDCHGLGMSEGGVTLDEFTNGEELLDHDLWLAVLNNVRKGIMPPAEEFQPTQNERERIASWIKDSAFKLDPNQPDPGRVTVRRLNRVEYQNTILDLMGVEFNAEIEFPADDSGHGFDNIADVLTISPMLLEKYLDAAQHIVGEAVPQESKVVARRWVPGPSFESLVPIEEPTEAPEAIDDEYAEEAVVVVAAKPDAEIWQAGEKDDYHIELSFYHPAKIGQTLEIRQAGDYEVEFDLRLVERYVDGKFDLNEADLVLKFADQVVHERKLVREGWRGFSYLHKTFLEPGSYELVVELYPRLPAQPQVRDLGVRLNHVLVRGPMDPAHWVTPDDYEDYFPRPVPASATAQEEYRRELLGDFARRAFRRPIESETLDRLVSVARTISSQPGSNFEKGVAQAMVAVLASPGFLFRQEAVIRPEGDQRFAMVDEYSLASRLSYFLWSTMPDDELMALADAGELRANLSAQVRRMLDDPRSDQLVENFTGQWLQARDVLTVPIQDFDVYLREGANQELRDAYAVYRRLGLIPRAQRTEAQLAEREAALQIVRRGYRSEYPRFRGRLREAMQSETEMYFDHLLREDRSVIELIESDYTFLNEDLAEHYGIDHEEIKGRKLRKVTLPEGSMRGGVLTQGTLLAVTSNPTRTSPVKRGVFILENILGAPPPPPPPNIPGLEDAASEEELKLLSLRETLALHASEPTCASCHMRMDPLGLALENFNAMGAYREMDMNQPVRPEGRLISGESFSDIRELKTILATDRRDDFLHTLTEKLLTYALGRGMEYYDIATIDQIVHRLEANEHRMSALIEGVIESAPFQQTRISASQLAKWEMLEQTASQSLVLSSPESP